MTPEQFPLNVDRRPSGGYFARPAATLGTCGSHPFLWTVAAGPTPAAARAAFISAHRRHVAQWAARMTAATTGPATTAAHAGRLTDEAEADAANAQRYAANAADAYREAAATWEAAADHADEADARQRAAQLTAAAVAWSAAARAAREAADHAAGRPVYA